MEGVEVYENMVSSGAVVDWVMSNAGGVADSQQVIETLRRQLTGLDSVEQNLRRAVSRLPTSRGNGVWRGAAHRLYVEAIDELAAALSAAGMQLDDAIGQTRAALSSLADGV